ncbi:diphosphomevalonate decarboxylase [Aggregatilineales bacterium SYSU G02658]
MSRAVVQAHPNIAFIKYWGNVDDRLKLPTNSSISMNLGSIYTQTSVEWDASLESDRLTLNDVVQTGEALHRVVRHLDLLRERLGVQTNAHVVSANNFPMGAGIASSASSFAALTVAAVKAAQVDISERELTTLARIGSGSAARSVPAGFVEWHKGDSHETSYAETIFAPDHWDLVDVVAVVSTHHKRTGSEAGHPTARTSVLQSARVADAERRVSMCRHALSTRDFDELAAVVELDSNLMHAVMMTSQPPLFYWEPASVQIMKDVQAWRAAGLPVCYTLDAGPNVHCLCESSVVDELVTRLRQNDGILDIKQTSVGGGAVVLDSA